MHVCRAYAFVYVDDVYLYIYVVAFQFFISDTWSQCWLRATPRSASSTHVPIRPRVRYFRFFTRKNIRKLTQASPENHSNLHPLPKNRTSKSLTQINERWKSKNPTKGSTYQSQSSMDFPRKVPGNATAPATVVAPPAPKSKPIG